jgi:hypothetical protein
LTELLKQLWVKDYAGFTLLNKNGLRGVSVVHKALSSINSVAELVELPVRALALLNRHWHSANIVAMP